LDAIAIDLAAAFCEQAHDYLTALWPGETGLDGRPTPELVTLAKGRMRAALEQLQAVQAMIAAELEGRADG
jgi:hypothetical protein